MIDLELEEVGILETETCPGPRPKTAGPGARRDLRRSRLVWYNHTMSKTISHGVVHKVPTDLRQALTSDRAALAIWEDLTPLARNEWICWVTFVKKDETRKEHVKRTISELKEGMRRPCCWLGCIHRKDKPISPSVQAVLDRRSKKSK